jgi:hypothetical protein
MIVIDQCAAGAGGVDSQNAEFIMMIITDQP